MSSKNNGSSVSPGTVLSAFCLILYSAGFIRMELKFNDHDQRLVAVEEAISQLKHGMAETSNKETVVLDSEKKEKRSEATLQRIVRSVIKNPPSNNSANLKEVLEEVVTTSFKNICQSSGTLNVCPRGPAGNPGKAGTKGDKGEQGRRGRKGSKGDIGRPGRNGKQGLMGQPGRRGGKGIKGQIGAPGIPGIRGHIGPPGIPGIKGNVGATGAPGASGRKGAVGAPGRVCGPIGVADRSAIPDYRMTASSIYDGHYYPYYGRLHVNRGFGGWCPRPPYSGTDYLQVDMGTVRSVCGVATQGGGGHSEWTTRYKIYISINGVTWNAYKENNVVKVSEFTIPYRY
ncbi:hypothetical protein ACROYT_G022879 [Oculina patagonica]